MLTEAGFREAVAYDHRGYTRLLGFVQDGLPAYAWTNDEDHPWTTSRSPRLRSVLRWLTSS